MDLRDRFISVDDHAQEHPRVWTYRLSSTRWGDRIPHLAERPDGTQYWVVDGQPLPLRGVAAAGATLPDRSRALQRWEEVPSAAYDPKARLAAMDQDGVTASVLYPTVAGVPGRPSAGSLIRRLSSRVFRPITTGSSTSGRA
jgi:hypothetical protein